MKQYETIDWKQYAQLQQQARKSAEQNLSRVNIAFNKARQMSYKILGYSRKLERQVRELQETLKRVKQSLQQQKATVQILEQENHKLRLDFTAQQTKLQTTLDAHTKAQKQLEFLDQKVKFCDAIQLLNVNNDLNQSHDTANSLDQFFVYQPGNNAIATESRTTQ